MTRDRATLDRATLDRATLDRATLDRFEPGRFDGGTFAPAHPAVDAAGTLETALWVLGALAMALLL